MLELRSLQLYLKRRKGKLQILTDIDLSLNTNEILGIAGESGSGKTVTTLSLTRLLPQPPWNLEWRKYSVLGMEYKVDEINKIKNLRGRIISYIFQNPFASLDPMFSIGFQLKELLQSHGRDASKKKMIELLSLVKLSQPENILKSYPHQLSGGMAQRVTIALCLAGEPKIIIADEPTTALDANIRRGILDLFKDLKNKGLSIIFISHDLHQIFYLSDRVMILYAGRVVEEGPKDEVLKSPAHPYTIALLECLPDPVKGRVGIKEISGEVPNFLHLPQGCKFHPRCKMRIAICLKKEPALVTLKAEHLVRCHRAHEIWKKY